jgi:hypothetical protein
MPDYSTLTADPEDLDAEAIAELLRAQQRDTAAQRASLQDTLSRQQGQAGQLRGLNLLTSFGQNPLLRGLQQSSGQQGAQMEGNAARTESRLATLGRGSGDPVSALLKLRAARQRDEYIDIARDRLDTQKNKAASGAAAADEKRQKDAEKRIWEVEAQLRKEVLQSETGKKYMEAKTAYKSIEGFVKNPSPANDMAIVFAAMKSLDPDSVVKEGEQVQVRNTTNLPGRLLNYLEKAKSGQNFDAAQRAEIQEMARLGFAARASSLKDLSDAYAPIAAGAGANMGNVMPLDTTIPPPVTTPKGQPPAPGPQQPKPLNPRDFVKTFEGPDGKKYGRRKDGSVVRIMPDGTLVPVTVKD